MLELKKEILCYLLAFKKGFSQILHSVLKLFNLVEQNAVLKVSKLYSSISCARNNLEKQCDVSCCLATMKEIL